MPLDWIPSDDFRKSQHAKPWQAVAESETFRKAIEAAYVQATFDFPKAVDHAAAAANEFRRQGAVMALFRLMNLNTPLEKPKEKDVSNQNLDHKA